MLIRAFVFTIAMLGSYLSYAYPNFIGKGYHNCLTCHYNPYGNGPLNDYGRGVAASGISDRAFISKKISDEKLSDISGFYFNKPTKKSYIKPSLDYRGLYLKRDLQTDDPQTNWINMQMDASVVLELGKKKQYTVTYTHSFVPDNSLPAGHAMFDVAPGEHLNFSREHYIGYKMNKSMSVYLGKMDKVFGIRVPDHTAFSRTKTGNGQYDATHGVVGHLTKEKFDLGVQVFMGDFEKESVYRSQGLSSKFEYSVNEKLRAGISVLHEEFDAKTNTAYAIISKIGIGKGSSVMLEFGRVNVSTTSASPITQQYIFLQNHYYLRRGLYFMTTYEQFIDDVSGASEEHRISPGIQYFPWQRLEIRADLTNNKSYGTNVAVKDSWTFLGQVHLWF
ncbi:MAG: hypothetical protein HON90_06500 [Halobacteriovoraceae bacterium]|jgi:hypothetical protein|nr:hypothetical protein [Halobacteriovoraceae bacterium]